MKNKLILLKHINDIVMYNNNTSNVIFRYTQKYN